MRRRKLIQTRSGKRGLPPGTPIYVGEAAGLPPDITVFDYDADKVLEERVGSIEECFPFRDKPSVTWINIDGLQNVQVIGALAERFGLHPLVQEDVVNTDHRPKVEDFDDYIFIVVKMMQWDAANEEATIEQVSLVLGENFVISFQERPGDVLEAVRGRIRAGKGRIRRMGSDYLAYSLLDAIVDGYFAVLERRGEQVELLEDELISRPGPETLKTIYQLKRDGLFIRKSIWPVREMVAGLERLESPLVGDGLSAYLRDLYDHTIQVIDTTETLRDMLSGMLDTYLSSVSNRMNEVMKVLTIVATIFIPLTFIAGIYGMNFKAMPELEWRWGYAGALLLMVAVAVGMILYIKRKKWI
jgi:magnesium transporter